jgi:hypothetical protein
MSRRFRLAVVVLGAAAIAALIVLAALNPANVLRGWLAAMVWSSMIPIGALTLLLTHRLTGGEWGFALAPVLEPAARAIAGVALLFVPVLLFPHLIYSWQSSPETPREVTRFYLNAPFFAALLRSASGVCSPGCRAYGAALWARLVVSSFLA